MAEWYDLPWREMIDTDEWKALVLSPRRLLRHRVVLVDDDDAEIMEVPFTGGSVTASFDGVSTYDCRVIVSDPTLVPVDSNDPLDARSGYKIRVWWEIWEPSASVWVGCPMGKFTPEDPATALSSSVTTTLVGSDPLAMAKRNDYGVTAINVGGLTIDRALANLFDWVATDTPLRFGETTEQMPWSFTFGEETPADDWDTTAALAGWEVYCDPDGSIVADEIPEDSVRGELISGDGCKVITANIARKTSEIANCIYVQGTNTDVNPPVWAVAEDDDEGSPTWIGGPLGRRTRTIESDKIATLSAARRMATKYLRRYRRPTATVDLTLIQRPDVLFGDEFVLNFEEAGIEGTFRVAGWTIPLIPQGGSAQPMSMHFFTKTYE